MYIYTYIVHIYIYIQICIQYTYIQKYRYTHDYMSIYLFSFRILFMISCFISLRLRATRSSEVRTHSQIKQIVGELRKCGYRHIFSTIRSTEAIGNVGEYKGCVSCNIGLMGFNGV